MHIRLFSLAGGESPDWKDLQALDDKLDKLSFDISKSDDGADDYEDDFQR